MCGYERHDAVAGGFAIAAHHLVAVVGCALLGSRLHQLQDGHVPLLLLAHDRIARDGQVEGDVLEIGAGVLNVKVPKAAPGHVHDPLRRRQMRCAQCHQAGNVRLHPWATLTGHQSARQPAAGAVPEEHDSEARGTHRVLNELLGHVEVPAEGHRGGAVPGSEVLVHEPVQKHLEPIDALHRAHHGGDTSPAQARLQTHLCILSKRRQVVYAIIAKSRKHDERRGILQPQARRFRWPRAPDPARPMLDRELRAHRRRQELEQSIAGVDVPGLEVVDDPTVGPRRVGRSAPQLEARMPGQLEIPDHGPLREDPAASFVLLDLVQHAAPSLLGDERVEDGPEVPDVPLEGAQALEGERRVRERAALVVDFGVEVPGPQVLPLLEVRPNALEQLRRRHGRGDAGACRGCARGAVASAATEEAVHQRRKASDNALGPRRGILEGRAPRAVIHHRSRCVSAATLLSDSAAPQ
mmetsp:Transcript_21482/g.54873  ORF Transcript_21482/g.54873 Transcript_21482/m.54873 type:complete len:467 (+) Transcript_21482:223-1623(+)